ncbi:substrate-binding domain-containing protein [Candidatus Rariloculus sp.]|uniref:substrate-binding domain-containing protein n=1 Tax=Candidatus Rariloculus sp. TaxID=3101265 RepID=UPI003D11026A
MKGFAFVAAALAATLSVTTFEVHAQSSSLRVLSSNGVKAVVESLQPEIERAVGSSLSIEFSTASSLKGNIEQGEPFDVAILTPALIADLVDQDSVAAESRIDFARAGVGVGARPNTGSRDVSTPEALRLTLLDAESVAFTADGQSRITIDRAFGELGIAEEMGEKTILMGPGQAPAAVAAGEAELVMTLVSEILPVPGLELVGPFPAEVQGYVSFAAGRGTAAEDARAADALLDYLSGPDFAAALAMHGMESVGR